MAKKKFDDINITPLYDIENSIMEEKPRKERKTYTEQEAAEALEKMNTSGKKGVKLPRINLAFSPSNYEYIKTMSQVRGQSATDFVNDIIKKDLESHAELYKKAVEFREMF